VDAAGSFKFNYYVKLDYSDSGPNFIVMVSYKLPDSGYGIPVKQDNCIIGRDGDEVGYILDWSKSATIKKFEAKFIKTVSGVITAYDHRLKSPSFTFIGSTCYTMTSLEYYVVGTTNTAADPSTATKETE